MGQIQVMTEALANQIAAGEVVERPASCIKELVENSLDAGAKTIMVHLEEGGIRKMRVQDDGQGMDQADLTLAFARHATSKLKTPRDLLRIATLGFRGEALASVAAVARVTLQSRTQDQDEGYGIRVEGSQLQGKAVPVGMPKGTIIEVEDLFFNTPARLKYLRTVATEQARCVETIQRAALSRPDVRFRVEVDGRVLFQTNGDGRLVSVLAALYGVGEAGQFLPVEGVTSDYRVHGYVGRPTQAKSNRTHANLFINQRPIRNLSVHQGVVAGYHERLMVHRHPIYALYIEMNPGLVDVNIHPHKSEVRFSEERDLVLVVQQAVRKALDETFLVPTARFGAGVNEVARLHTDPEGTSTNHLHRSVQTALSGDFVRPQYPAGSRSQNQAATRQPSSNQTVPKEVYETIYANTENTAKAEIASVVREETAVTEQVVEETRELRRDSNWHLRPIGQALGMYILADDGEDLYVIDQHAAHERILYEKFTKRMLAEERYQLPLLTPITLHLSPSDAAMLEAEREVIEEMGLTLDAFGGYSFILRTIPDIWDGLDAQRLALEVVEGLRDDSRTPDVRAAVRERVVMRSCKAAIKANHRLSDMEMRALCDSLSSLEDPFHCPHGRPVFIRMTSHELEKEFRRIV